MINQGVLGAGYNSLLPIHLNLKIYVLYRYECIELYNLCTVDEVQMEKPIMSSIHKTI